MWSPTFAQVEDDGTAIAEAVRKVMNLTFDPISKQPFFVGMTKMCHQVGSKGLRDDEVEILFCSNTSAQLWLKQKLYDHELSKIHLSKLAFIPPP